MSFNSTECEVIHISTNRNPIKSSFIHNTEYNRWSKIHGRYHHTKSILELTSQKSNSTMPFVRRNIHYSQSSATSTAIKTYICVSTTLSNIPQLRRPRTHIHSSTPSGQICKKGSVTEILCELQRCSGTITQAAYVQNHNALQVEVVKACSRFC